MLGAFVRTIWPERYEQHWLLLLLLHDRFSFISHNTTTAYVEVHLIRFTLGSDNLNDIE